jgi:hypothetical protein
MRLQERRDTMLDLTGRPYALNGEIKPGDIIQVDDGFDCIKPWSKHIVRGQDMYIECELGEHYLDGQLMFDHIKEQFYVGIYKV